MICLALLLLIWLLLILRNYRFLPEGGSKLEKTIEKPETSFPHLELTGHDRCDKCIAQAFMVAHKNIGGKNETLLFCGHHGRELLPILAINGWSIQDELSRINKKPTDPEHY